MNKITNQNASKTFVLPQYRGVVQMSRRCPAIAKFFSTPVDMGRLQKKIGASWAELSQLIELITGRKFNRKTLSRWATEAKRYRPRPKFRIGDEALNVIKRFIEAFVLWVSNNKMIVQSIRGRMTWRVKVVKI